MSFILVSFHLDVSEEEVELVFKNQNIVPFKKRTEDTMKTYHELPGVISRYIIEAPHAMLLSIRENLTNLLEVWSVYLCEEMGPKRTYRRPLETREWKNR